MSGSQWAKDLRVGIVGGSLTGCAVAISLARAGCEVTLLERSRGPLAQRGSGIGLPRDLIAEMKERDYFDQEMTSTCYTRRDWLVKEGDTPLGRTVFAQPNGACITNWRMLFQNLRRRVPEGSYNAGNEVAAIDARPDRVDVELADGEKFEFDLLIGADGYRSTVRRLLFPEAEDHFSGIAAWRGWLVEADGKVDMSAMEPDVYQNPCWENAHGVFWWAPSEQGADSPNREVPWLMYDLFRRDDAPDIKRDEKGNVIPIPRGQVSDEQLAYLHAYADDVLPPVLAEIVQASTPFLTPIYDVRVPTLVKDRVLMIGDAGIVVRPLTGSGLTKGLGDALAVAEIFGSAPSLEDALEQYDAERWQVANRLIELGLRLGDTFVLEAPEWRQMSSEQMEDLFEKVIQGTKWYPKDDAPEKATTAGPAGRD